MCSVSFCIVMPFYRGISLTPCSPVLCHGAKDGTFYQLLSRDNAVPPLSRVSRNGAGIIVLLVGRRPALLLSRILRWAPPPLISHIFGLHCQKKIMFMSGTQRKLIEILLTVHISRSCIVLWPCFCSAHSALFFAHRKKTHQQCHSCCACTICARPCTKCRKTNPASPSKCCSHSTNKRSPRQVRGSQRFFIL